MPPVPDPLPPAAPGAGAIRAAPATNLLSLAYLTVHGIDAVEQIEVAAAAGFDAVGLRILAPSHLDIDYGIIGERARIRAIRQACERTGVAVFDVEVITLEPGCDVARLQPMLETAANLGARFVQAVCEDPDTRRAGECFGRVCAAAAPLDLRVALEFMRFRPLQTLEAAVAIVSAAGAGNGAVLIDALHLSRSGGTPAGVAAIAPERIAYLQLCDAPAEPPPVSAMAEEARKNRLYPGEGGLWLDALFAALPPGVPVSVEVPHRLDALRSMAERARIAAGHARAWLDGFESRRLR